MAIFKDHKMCMIYLAKRLMDTQQKASPEDLIQSGMKTVSSHP